MIEHGAEAIEMGRNVRKEFENKYTADINYKILMNIYRAMDNHKRHILVISQ